MAAHYSFMAGTLLALHLSSKTYSSPSTSWDPPGDKSGFDRSAQTDLQPFYLRRRGPSSCGFTCASSSEPILSVVDPSPYPATVRRLCSDNGASSCWDRRPQARHTSRRFSDSTPSHPGAESRSLRLQTVPSRADVIPQHYAVPQSESEAGGCTGTFKSYSTLAIHVFFRGKYSCLTEFRELKIWMSYAKFSFPIRQTLPCLTLRTFY